MNPAAPLPANDQTDMTALLLAAAVHILLVGAVGAHDDRQVVHNGLRFFHSA